MRRLVVPGSGGARDRPPPTRGSPRLLVISSTVNALGSGIYLPLSLVVLNGLSGLSLPRVGLALTLAQLVALVVMPRAGRLLDQIGAKRLLISSLLAQAAGFVAYTLSSGFAVFLLISVFIALGNQIGKAARPVLIADVADGPQRDRLLALNRSLANAGLGLGGVILALLPKSDPGVYIWVSLANAVTFVIAALITVAIEVPPRPLVPADGAGLRSVLGDRRYARYLAAGTLSSVLYGALTTWIPLYVLYVLGLPSTFAGLLFTVNTVLSAVGGVPVVAGVQRVGLSNRVAAALGVLLLGAGIAIIGAADLLTGWAAMAVVTAAMVVYTLGELVHSPSSSSLSLTSAPPDRRGEYQAVYQMTWTIGAAVAPLTFTWFLEHFPAGGNLTSAVLAVLSAGLLLGGQRPVREPRRMSRGA